MENKVQAGRLRGVVAFGAVTLLAGALGIAALVLDRAWLERHILPDFFEPRGEQLAVLLVARVALGACALALVWPVGPRIARWAARRGVAQMLAEVAPILLAVLLSLGASEMLLRSLRWFSTHEVSKQREPQRRRDPVLGWTNAPDRVGRGLLGGRMIEYAFDRDSHRVARAGVAVDYAQPTVLFVGESIIDGHGVTYDETIPARVGARLGVQPANLGVGGYATDQMYMRFRAEWPRYRHPCAVVALYMPSLHQRNLDRDRPHLDASLTWRPPAGDPRILQIVRRLIPYRSDRELAEGMRMTHAALEALVRATRARGAIPLILVPELDPETPDEAAIREAALAGLPSLKVTVDPSWRVPDNRHPDARADAKLAEAVAGYLERRGVGRGNACSP